MGRGTHRGFITYEELNKSLGKRNLSDENLAQAFIHILDENVSLVEKKSDFKVLKKKDNSNKEDGKTIEKSDDLALSVKKSFALADFIKASDGTNLIQGFKRANNILLQAEQTDGVEYSYGADLKYAEEDAERNLFSVLDNEEVKIRNALEKENFVEAMNSMAKLREPSDSFFETVQINSDVDVIRRNRLNLLSRICKLCLSVADLTKVEE